MELQQYEKEHIKKLRPLLPECTVLLKSNGDFPLKEPCEIALYGNGVRHTVKGGTGSGEVNSRYYYTVEKGFQKSGFTITSAAWLDGYDKIRKNAFEQFKKDLATKAKAEHTQVMMLAMGATMPEPEYELPLDAKGDAAVYVLSRDSGEGTDRNAKKGDIFLTDTECRDILNLQKKYKKFMLVLNVGGVVDLSPVLEVENILLLSQLGVETGAALARILLGRQYPSGKLATTWAAWKEYEYLDFGGEDDTRYQEGIYVGYRYFDTMKKEVLFPFGYGLGYTTFKLERPTVSVNRSKVTVSVNVKNTGTFRGKEVVQAYVSVPALRLDQPYQRLAAWGKTPEIAPDENREVQISFDMADIASYDAGKAAWVLEEGDYVVRVGTHSRQTCPAAILKLSETVLVEQVKNALGKPDFTDFVPRKQEKPGSDVSNGFLSSNVCPTGAEPTVFSIDAGCFTPHTVSYQKEYEIAEETRNLSDKTLALLANGSFGKGGLMGIVGNAATSVCGAAGETAHVKGFRPIIMADGPAGIRIDKRYFIDQKGKKMRMALPFPQSMVPFLPKAVKFAAEHFIMKKPKASDQIRYQYCTALPIGTALAQSFNPMVAEACGDIAGAEMERFGIDLWLAPALNLHRSIQCGRNFEYYSEDALVSGKFAAAVTRGVQKHPNKGVTIKHFAANNQEYNRTSSNSMVSERAMREIYLKGFEICVKESSPKAVMTSYNLVNGQHTSTRRDLIEDILRCEFGFDGLVMTDWVIQGGMIPDNAKYDSPLAGDVASAGGDLFMPGSREDYEDILDALEEGRLDRRQLQINATRILKFWL